MNTDETPTPAVLIQLELLRLDPPSGSVVADSCRIPFEGWLGILQALEDLIGPMSSGGPDKARVNP